MISVRGQESEQIDETNNSIKSSFDASTDATDEDNGDKVPDSEEDEIELESGEQEYLEALKYLTGDGVEKNISKGKELLQLAADLEYPPAQNHLGLAYAEGLEGYRKSKKKAVNYFKLSAAAGDPYGRLNYAEAFYFGELTVEDNDKAMEILTRIWEQRDDYEPDEGEYGRYQSILARSQFYMGTLYMIKSAETDSEEESKAIMERSFQAYTHAADLGHFEGTISVAMAYAFGQGAEVDFKQANYYLDNALKIKNQNISDQLYHLQNQNYLDHLDIGDAEDELVKTKKKIIADLQFKIAEIIHSKEWKDDVGIEEAIKWYELAAESGKPWAMLELAYIYYNGEGALEKDYSRALHWFCQASDEGNHSLGSYNAAVMYFRGEGTEKDPAKAREYLEEAAESHMYVAVKALKEDHADKVLTYDESRKLMEKAAKKGDLDASFYQGYRYYKGWGYKKDYGKAFKIFKKAAKKGHTEAQYYTGYFYRSGLHVDQDLKRAKEWYEKAAEKDHFDALFGLAYIHGKNYLEKYEDQARYYERCLELEPENGSILNNLAVMYEKGRYYRKDETNAIAFYERAVEAGSTKAAENLGVTHYYGLNGLPVDYRKALEYFQKAAEGDHVKALRHLGYIHELGLVFEQSYEDAAYYYRLAALEDDNESLVKICSFYLEGKGVSQNYKRAEFWLVQLINQGHRKYLFLYAAVLIEQERFEEALKWLKNCRKMYYEKGDRVVDYMYGEIYFNPAYKDHSRVKGFKYMKKAADEGIRQAQVKVGEYYREEENWDKAFRYFKQAARLSDPYGIYYVGELLLKGKGTPTNETSALKHFQVAAGAGVPEALYALAKCHQDGLPGAPDKKTAIEYLEKAKESGYAEAEALLRELQAEE